MLRRFDSHATFFEIGQETAGRVSTMRKILAQGNEIGNHSLHHEMDPSSASLRKTNRLIRSSTGFRPCDFRPPDGGVNNGLIQRAHALRMTTVNWEVDPRDWASPGVGAITSNVIHNAHNGSIVVMHDRGRQPQRDGGGPAGDPLPLPPPGLQLRNRGRAARPRVHLPQDP